MLKRIGWTVQNKWRDTIREQLNMTIKLSENVIMDPNKSNFSGVLRVGAIIQLTKCDFLINLSKLVSFPLLIWTSESKMSLLKNSVQGNVSCFGKGSKRTNSTEEVVLIRETVDDWRECVGSRSEWLVDMWYKGELRPGERSFKNVLNGLVEKMFLDRVESSKWKQTNKEASKQSTANVKHNVSRR